jgi:WD40 repeat protein
LEDRHGCKSHALVCAFNRFGTLLGIGCLDGNILIYDFIAKTLSKTIQVHAYLIYSLSWSNKGDILLSCLFDYTICLWSIINNPLFIYLGNIVWFIS